MTDDSYAIEDNVPIPTDRGVGRPMKYPLDTLEVGQSFTIPLAERQAVSVRIAYYSKAHGVKFTTRKVDENTLRVWRTE